MLHTIVGTCNDWNLLSTRNIQSIKRSNPFLHPNERNGLYTFCIFIMAHITPNMHGFATFCCTFGDILKLFLCWGNFVRLPHQLSAHEWTSSGHFRVRDFNMHGIEFQAILCNIWCCILSFLRKKQQWKYGRIDTIYCILFYGSPTHGSDVYPQICFTAMIMIWWQMIYDWNLHVMILHTWLDKHF